MIFYPLLLEVRPTIKGLSSLYLVYQAFHQYRMSKELVKYRSVTRQQINIWPFYQALQDFEYNGI